MSVIVVVVGNLLEFNVNLSPDSTALSLQSNDFELFQLTPKAELDSQMLKERWRELQDRCHPDRFASSGDSARRVAMQYSVRVNEAYQRLRNPLTRFAYLCELNGVSIDAESNTSMPSEFLVQQMQWREALEEAQVEADINHLQTQVDLAKETLERSCIELIDQQKDFKEASASVRSLMFVDRFQNDIDKRADILAR
jgi:molecular chaperone HscB